jgi:beta-lactamase class A
MHARRTALLFLLPLLCFPQSERERTQAEKQIRRLVPSGGTKLFYFAKNLRTGQTLSHLPDEKVRTASTIKLPILIEVYAQAAAGRLQLDEELTLTTANTVSGAGVLHEFTPGTKLRIRDVANLMIVVSDNTATNMLIERITADAVNARMDELGLPATRSMRKVRGDGTQLKEATGWSKAGLMEENKRFGLGSSTSREMVHLLEMLHAGKVVNAESSATMLNILKRQQDNTGIQRRVDGFPIANKSGALDHLRSDVGVFYTKNGPVAMAITVEDIPGIDYRPDNPGNLLLAEAARIITRTLDKP